MGINLVEAVEDATIGSSSASAIKEKDGTVRLVPAIAADISVELPRINYAYNMKPYTYAYCIQVTDWETCFNPDALVKFNMKTGEVTQWTDPEYFTSEPVFVANPDGGDEEDNGVLITILLHRTETEKCALLVLDARNMKELARVNFTAEGTVSATFHGQFVDRNEKTHLY